MRTRLEVQRHNKDLIRLCPKYQIFEDINTVLEKHGIPGLIHNGNLTITKNTVSDLVKEEQVLSDLITNNTWPSIVEPTEVYHYTSQKKAENIILTNLIRLNSISRRFNDGEIGHFCEDHKLTGYLQKDQYGEPEYKSLMNNIYYASFTQTDLNQTDEDYFWRTFASNGGYRLKFEITATNPDFRRIHYNVPIAILNDIESVVKKYNLSFIYSGISRLCAFYLKEYSHEKEYRILHRYWDCEGVLKPKYENPNGSDIINSYYEIPLGETGAFGYSIKLLEVHGKTKPNNLPDSVPFSLRV